MPEKIHITCMWNKLVLIKVTLVPDTKLHTMLSSADAVYLPALSSNFQLQLSILYSEEKTDKYRHI